MTKWEYSIVELPQDVQERENLLNKQGIEGWELVTIYTDQVKAPPVYGPDVRLLQAVLKRPLIEWKLRTDLKAAESIQTREQVQEEVLSIFNHILAGATD